MNAGRLLALYDRVAEAPDAIPRLRRFVLDLAVRGKLVEQNSTDEPASELLKRIAAAKTRLVKAGKISKAKKDDATQLEDLPFAIPRHWQPTKLEHVLVELQTGPFGSSLHQSDYCVGGTPVINPASIQKEKIVPIAKMAVHVSTLERLASFKLRSGDIVMARRGDMGRCALVGGREAGWLCGTGSLVLRPSKLVFARFLVLLIGSPFGRHYFGGSAVGSTMQNLNQAILLNLPFGLPPLGEQRRIVAKVDEMMALCDRLETTRTTREATRDRLTTSSLARLTAPGTDAQTLRTHARFALDALHALTTRPDQIKTLRQTILNLAVRGKLVEQDPLDPPPAVAKIADSGFPECLPRNWRHTSLEILLSENTRNGYSRRPDDAEDGVPILRISAGTVRQDGLVSEEDHKLISGIDESMRLTYGLERGDLLACRFNGNKAFVGRLTLFSDYLRLRPIYPDKLIRVRLNRQHALPEFIRMAGESYLVRTSIEALCATTVGNWGISGSNLKRVSFPVPPLAEQHRIVAKVDALMAICDRLESGLHEADANRRRLLDALLHEALHYDALVPAAETLEVAG